MIGGDAASMYHAGSRSLQDAFDTLHLADRLQERLSRTAFTAEDAAWKRFEMFRDVLPRR